ncbi:GerMN domain-containing protein [Tumebacillus lipolyticus]|uniref:GerMN domain-containing protein n=1 Tax=Tumebacillus lipolyticus TaxID=1280370 RepID=A0ABW4ZXH1_9BACL
MVKLILLFTVTACPTGRNIGTVLREVVANHPEVALVTKYVEIDVEETNRYRIKQNPTVLFLDGNGQEICRLTGMQETEQVEAALQLVNSGNGNVQREQYEENQAKVESYTIYLYQHQELLPVQIEYDNQTGIGAPRITAVQLMLKAQRSGYENPFPQGTKLLHVHFPAGKGRIVLQTTHEVDVETEQRMHKALQATLSHFQVAEIELIIEGAKEEVQ